MNNLGIASIITLIVLIASILSIEFGIASAIIEIILGAVIGNLLGIEAPQWLTFIAGLGGILLTFLAGAEVDIPTMKEKFFVSTIIGGLSFLLPFLAVLFYTHYVEQWSWDAAKIGGIALSTTSLAVVYAVLVETGLNKSELGKIIMASTFITDFGTAFALSILFLEFNSWTIFFFIFSIILLLFGTKLVRYFFNRYGNKVIEPEIKLLFFIFFLCMFLGELGKSHAVLPIFVLGFILSPYFEKNRQNIRKLRTIGFALITPFFFIKGGMLVDFNDISSNILLIIILLAIKIGAKIVGVYSSARIMLPQGGRVFLTLLMSTGLTFGTISSLFGYQAGFIDKSQFSVLISVVILSAVVPTIIAQKYWAPIPPEEKDEIIERSERL